MTSTPSGGIRLRLGTRSSPLARWQADWVAAQLRAQGVEVETILITTTGDVTDQSLQVAGGQGLFTKEIQRALQQGRIDLAVHSLKDLPTEPVDGLCLAAVPPREDPSDVLVSGDGAVLESLLPGSLVGTGSRRRQSQLLHVRPDLRVGDIRGNVETRLRKLDRQEYCAIVLAHAGLNRLGLTERITQVLPPSVMLPAVGQGALGLETRSDDEPTRAALKSLNDSATHAAVLAERCLLAGLRAGCLAPVGAWARTRGSDLHISAVVLSADGQNRISVTLLGKAAEPAALGQRAAAALLAMGAEALINSSRTT